MKDAMFSELLESVTQMDEIQRGQRKPSRTMQIDPVEVKAIREMTGLSQANFARLILVDVGTLRNWEQGRRQPTGPARALLKAIKRDPEHVIRAVQEA